MPVWRRMPHSHHSGSVNANFSLVRQVFRRIPILEEKNRKGKHWEWAGGECHSNLYLPIPLVRQVVSAVFQFLKMEKYGLGAVRRGVSRQSIFASITSHSIIVQIFNLRLLILTLWVISRY